MDETTRQLVKSVADEAATEAVRRTLLTLGIDSTNPIETQADMAHLRQWRKSLSAVKRQGLLTTMGIVVSGILALIWVEFTSKGGK